MAQNCYGCKHLGFEKDTDEGARGSFIICKQTNFVRGYIGYPPSCGPMHSIPDSCDQYKYLTDV